MATASRLNTHFKSPDASLLSDWLTLLGVSHTHSYTLSREKNMPFKTWFGLARALEEYGVDSSAYFLPDKEGLSQKPLSSCQKVSGHSAD